MKKKPLLITIVILINIMSSIAQVNGSFTDLRDKSVYKTVIIGTQSWMAENLKYKTEDSWCYDNDSNNYKIYGRLYTLQEASLACPEGWQLPSKFDWYKLQDALSLINKNIVNSDFSALAGGERLQDGTFNGIGDYGYWWSNTAEIEGVFSKLVFLSIYRHFIHSQGDEYSNPTPGFTDGFSRATDRSYGLSVRCLKKNN